MVAGKCVFPFKHKRVEHNECALSDDKTFGVVQQEVNKKRNDGNLWFVHQVKKQ